MTLILGVEDPNNDRAIVACDSGAWRGDEIGILREPKVWRKNGWVIGLAGTWAQSIACRSVELPECSPGDPKRESHVQAFAISVAACIAKSNELVRRTDPNEPTRDAGLVVAHGWTVWGVGEGCAISTTGGYLAEGTSDYAAGALEGIRAAGTMSALPLALLTLRTVYGITRMIHPPFRWFATDGSEGEE